MVDCHCFPLHRLVEQNRGLDEARREFEKARAQFYKHPNDVDLRATMALKEANVADFRSGRSVLEESLKNQAVDLRKIIDILQVCLEYLLYSTHYSMLPWQILSLGVGFGIGVGG